MKRTLHNSDFSREVPSDVTVHAGDTSFPLHKLPLVSKCGYIRKLVSECSDADLLTDIEAPNIPGGAEGFELAAKFCYGINFEIGTENVVMLRCVSEYLEMTEDYAVGNLVGRCEAFLKEVALKSLAGSVLMLRASVDFFPMAERVNLVNRCVDAVAYVACEESHSQSQSETQVVMAQPESVVQWWAEDVTGLRIDHFQRVVVAMKARGFEECGLGPVLILYAQKSLEGLEMFGKGVRKRIDPQEQHEKRVVIETIVSLLPQTSIPITFLSMLLRSAIHLETTVACRLDLEKRIASQLAQASLEDLLIPFYISTGDTLFDSDTVQRILASYLRCRKDGAHLSYGEEECFSSAKSDIERVGKLMESYLAEIAFDCNLSVAKFINLAELVPEQARVTEDGMYRAIDIYLKAHPGLTDMERKKLCSLMDCQKLTREACAHAAQNDRLPVQTVLQVLYHEQQRLRSHVGSDNLIANEKLAQMVPEEVSRLRRENEGMKMEMAEMRMKLEEIAVTRTVSSADKTPSLPRKSFVGAVAKKLGRLLPLFRAGGDAPANGPAKAPKDRRHSIS